MTDRQRLRELDLALDTALDNNIEARNLFDRWMNLPRGPLRSTGAADLRRQLANALGPETDQLLSEWMQLVAAQASTQREAAPKRIASPSSPSLPRHEQ